MNDGIGAAFMGPKKKMQHRGFSVFVKRSQTAVVSLQPSSQQGRGVSVHPPRKMKKVKRAWGANQ